MSFSNRIWRFLLKLFFSRTCKLRILHGERGKRNGAWILAANHISHFDPPLLSVATRRTIDWMAMGELFSNRIFGWLLKSVGAFPVKRGKPDRQALREAVGRLKTGRVIGIFPEGGIRDGAASVLEGGEIRPGISMLAFLAETPVVPVVILGSDRLYNKTRWKKFRATTVWVGFGNAVLPTGDSPAEKRADFEKKLQEALRSLREEMIQHFGLSSDDLPKPPMQRMKE